METNLTYTYPFEVGGTLHLPDGLHESVSDDDTDVSSRVALGLLAEGDKVRVIEAGGCGAKMKPKHEGAGMFLRQGDVDPLLKPDTNTPEQVDDNSCSGLISYIHLFWIIVNKLKYDSKNTVHYVMSMIRQWKNLDNMLVNCMVFDYR